MKKLFQRARDYFLRDLWKQDPPPGPRGWLAYLSRTAVMVVEGSWNQELMVRAAALTFKVAFSIIPLLAVILALFKGFGGFRMYADQVRDFILKYLAAGLADKVSANINEIVERTNATALGLVGFGILLYSSISLLASIEAAFNVIWGVRRQRTLFRQITVYWTILTIGPIALAVTLGTRATIMNHRAFLWLTSHVPLLDSFLIWILPFVMIWLVFTMMYTIMPNTRVPMKPAFIGALVSGTAWEILFRLYVDFNGFILDRYAIYGSLSVIPVFLMWIYVSWIIVLFGAEVAFAAQHVRTYKREVEAVQLSAQFKERLGLHLMIEIARDFAGGRDPATAEALAQRLKVPVRACNEVLFHLVKGLMLRELANGQIATYVPSEDLDRITPLRVLEAMRRHGHEPSLEPADRIDRIVQESEAAAAAKLGGVTLRELIRDGERPA